LEIVFTNPWVPMEWIKAHGHEPRGVWSLPDSVAGAAAEGVCPFAHRLRGLASAPRARPVVFTTACDQMRRAADAVREDQAANIFLFNLPATWQTPAARRLYHTEMKRLGRFLEGLGGQTPTAERLAWVMSEYDELRSSVRAFVRRKPARESAAMLNDFFARLSERLSNSGTVERPPGPTALPSKTAPPVFPSSEATGTSGSAHGVPLAVVGGPLLPAQWDLFDAIESAGGCVVLNATEPGERCLLPPLPATFQVSSDPLLALCDHYFDHITDAFQRPNSRLYQWLGLQLAERRVRGIVLWVHVGCDLWRAEAASLREAFGLPVLVLDSPEARGGGLRDLNRLGAFLESLR